MDASNRVATRFKRRLVEAESEDLRSVVKQALTVHGRIKTWLRTFPSTLREAQLMAPPGQVWQEPLIGFFEGYDMYQKQLSDLGRKLEALSLTDPKAVQAELTVEPPRSARVDQAIRDIDFADHPETGVSAIVYPAANLKGWFKQFSDWTSRSGRILRSIL